MLNGMTYALLLTFVASVTTWALAYTLGDLGGIEYGGELVYTNGEMQQAFITATLLNLLTQFAGVAWGILFSTLTRNDLKASDDKAATAPYLSRDSLDQMFVYDTAGFGRGNGN